jgi:folate-binding Fe-S cluster repair protein YgfZ
MVLLHLDGSTDDLPAHGEPVVLDGRAVGFIGTAVRHYELGTVALALIKRSLPDDAALRVGDSQAAIDPEPAAVA